MRPQVSRPVRYAVLTLVVALGAGLLWLGVVRLQAEKRAAAAADRGHAAPASASASASASALPAAQKPGAEVLVHVAGAVTSAGVFKLEAGARVADAVAAAGGPLPGAMPDALNLAARVNDGDKIYVPTVQEAKEAQAPVPAGKAPAKAPATASGSAAATARPVNINTASVADLDRVTGITPTLAKAIVAYRVQKGPFRQLDELTAVRGVDRALVDKLRPRLTI